MSGNQHHDKAATHLASAEHAFGPELAEMELNSAKVQATLALAYEQRTANLIAAFGNLLDDEVVTFLGERVDGYELAKVIQERLAL